MIESVEVKNYKVLDSIQIENLTQINIFVGKNNCGKTSLLEAIFLNFQPSNSMNIVSIVSNFVRQIQVSHDNLDYFFHQLDVSQPIEITSFYKQQKMHLQITPKTTNDFAQMLPNDININKVLDKKTDNAYITGLKFDIQFNGDPAVKSGFDIHENNIINRFAQADYPSFSGMMLPSHTFMNTASILARLRIHKKEKDLLQYLQIFDEHIQGIEVINGEIMVDLAGMSKKISFHTMGEGFKKYLAILASIIVGEYEYICIDEIENGLHFESMQKLLKAIIALAKETHIQLFISAHSYEFLEILNTISSEYQYEQIAIFNIARTNLKGLQTYKYDMKDLENLLKTKTEFRD
ncbi:AAA family ATPase [Helicobacter sp. MIT 21-1697]|uniref:AAA family ATPase n=1 Tax=Helicobacter sp. MIT 21-1697 TaxID=2993733 RepID=UPI00224ACE05|nr:AAA family ATPase [Helicobacter sp. MIT 21-1697]MCX2716350.1 AAA family ATPase [Helicobacter sp. MIT 21-1697]